MDALEILFAVLNKAAMVRRQLIACFGQSFIDVLDFELWSVAAPGREAIQIQVEQLMIITERLDDVGANIVEKDGRPTLIRYRVA